MNENKKLEYEWVIEIHDANGEIVDNMFADRLYLFGCKTLAAAITDGRLFLMRSLYSDVSLLERWYAPWCVTAPMLPTYAHFKFQDRPVPARFVAELRRAAAQQSAGATEVQ